MGTAYTPGLTVSPDYPILKPRRLPIAGEVLLKEGDPVDYHTVVARAELPGDVETIRLADRMQLDPDEMSGKVRVKVGDRVTRHQLLAESSGLFGLFRSEVKSPVDGTVEFYTEATGHLGIRRPPTRIEIQAYVPGRVVAIEKGQGVSIRTRGAFIQGIFGVGGERHGEIHLATQAADASVPSSDLDGRLHGKILVLGGCLDSPTLARAAEIGVVAVVAGGMHDADLTRFLGYSIGVAITGDERIPLTIVLTEGFGRIQMARRTFELLRSLDGRFAAVNGATQIRAGAVRPEIIVPHVSPEQRDAQPDAAPDRAAARALAVGTTVRAVRQPYFGLVGTVAELPPEPVRIGSGAVVRVLKVRLPDQREIVLPRSNVEIIEAT